MSVDWSDLRYLIQGTATQQLAYDTLRSLGVFEALTDYHPILVGTVPIDLDIEGSDLDIACQVQDLDQFERHLKMLYASLQDFTVKHTTESGTPSLVCDFVYGDFPIQLFGQATSVQAQRAYVHMLAEARLLSMAGADARESIRVLKRSGMKTEPAFSAFFQLSGDPFEVIFDLAEVDDEYLAEIVARARRT